MSTAKYQMICRVGSDPGIGDAYPSFELKWRSLLASRLRAILPIPPTALCPGIHRVIPIGVSSSDAIQAMEVAIPKDIQDPYAITVQSFAVDDCCGSIAITQPMQNTVIHIHCVINPGIIVDVCRELRVGHKAVVSEVHSVRQEMTRLKDTTNTQLCTVHEQLAIIQKEMTTLVTKLTKKERRHIQFKDVVEDDPTICSRKGCSTLITKRFRSGKRQKQCKSCQTHGARPNSCKME
jgi:hypothetical protein